MLPPIYGSSLLPRLHKKKQKQTKLENTLLLPLTRFLILHLQGSDKQSNRLITAGQNPWPKATEQPA